MKSDLQLKRWYAKYNRLYFNSELPDVLIYWEPSPAANAHTCESHEAQNEPYTIVLDPAMKGFEKLWHMTLLHEMIHVALWKTNPHHNHGGPFQREKNRLYELGALKRLW